MEKTNYLILPLLQAFCWFDDGLQAHLASRGWDHITRPQSMVVITVLAGETKPSGIARALGISRQAAHVTLLQLAKIGMVRLTDDPTDARAKTVIVTDKGRAMRADADEAVRRLTAELRRRIGDGAVDNLFSAFGADWGRPLVLPTPDAGKHNGATAESGRKRRGHLRQSD